MRKHLPAFVLAALGLAALAAIPINVHPAPTHATTTVGAGLAVGLDEYNCNPSTGWEVKGAFSNGSVMEARACLLFGGAPLLSARTEWRLRHGGTPITGVWDMDTPDGAGGAVYRQKLVRSNDGALITYRDWTSDVSGSFIRTDTPQDCDHTYSSASYFAASGQLRVYNPETGTKSGWKTQGNSPSPWSIHC